MRYLIHKRPPLALALALPPARLPIAPLFPRLLGLRLCFLRHRPWYLLPIAPAPKPAVQLLVRNLHTHLPPTPRHRLPYRPKPPFRYRLPHPPLLLLRPYLWAHSLTCASLPLLYPPPQTTSPTAIHMRSPTTSFSGFNRSPCCNIHSACHLLAIRVPISCL